MHVINGKFPVTRVAIPDPKILLHCTNKVTRKNMKLQAFDWNSFLHKSKIRIVSCLMVSRKAPFSDHIAKSKMAVDGLLASLTSCTIISATSGFTLAVCAPTAGTCDVEGVNTVNIRSQSAPRGTIFPGTLRNFKIYSHFCCSFVQLKHRHLVHLCTITETLVQWFIILYPRYWHRLVAWVIPVEMYRKQIRINICISFRGVTVHFEGAECSPESPSFLYFVCLGLKKLIVLVLKRLFLSVLTEGSVYNTQQWRVRRTRRTLPPPHPFYITQWHYTIRTTLGAAKHKTASILRQCHLRCMYSANLSTKCIVVQL